MITLVAAVFGFNGIAVAAAMTAKILFFIFLVLMAIFIIVPLISKPKGPPA